MQPIQGLHHVTAVAKEPQRNVDFYQLVLGQRLVKTTVNFDDPGTYHFYFADEIGTPGTVLTFFPWRNVARGRVGAGETSAVAYTIPPAAVAFWQDRLAAHDFDVAREERFGQTVMSFADPDGMRLELIAADEPATLRHWQAGPVPADTALRGFHGVTLLLNEVEPTARVLTEELGYTLVGQEANRYRYRADADDLATYVDMLHEPETLRGRFGAGSIHHIAFRTVDDAEQLEYLQTLRASGLNVTPVQDRQYFHSIYFRTPGGVLFEIATDAPGFLYDEPVEALGSELRLPPWLEPQRARIEAVLPAIERRSVAQPLQERADG